MKQSYRKAHAKPGGFQHKHSLGQNFLTDAALLTDLIDETGVGKEDHILEVGPGGGDMTRLLAARCKTVTAVEIDQDLLPVRIDKGKLPACKFGDAEQVFPGPALQAEFVGHCRL